jgi:hypothetical protein
MITDVDAHLHKPTDDPAWAETNYFGFYVPERNLNCGVYALWRPNLGVVHSTICLNSKRTTHYWETDYCNMQAHLPIPEEADLTNYRLANGLSVRCTKPNMAWEVDFEDDAGNGLHFEYRALMAPFDIQDPNQNPRAEGWGWGTHYNGHFDQTGVYTGEIYLAGETIPINCVSTMDHSWGVRPERGTSNMTWMHAHFGEDLAMHAIVGFDTEDRGAKLRVMNGYLLDNGSAHGLISGEGRATRSNGWFTDAMTMEVTDRRGQELVITGEAVSSFPWAAWPNVIVFNSLLRWREQGGREGYGETQDVVSLKTMTG